jgi:hypothetical protein
MGGAIGASQRGIDDRVTHTAELLILGANLGKLFLDHSFQAGVTDRLCPAEPVAQRIDARRNRFDRQALE